MTGDFYVMGDEALTGEDWEPKADGMTLKNGLYELTYSDVPVGTYSFRITDGTLDNTWPADADKTFKVRTAGDVTITFNATTREITVTTPDPVAALPEYYVAGAMNNWATNDIRYSMTLNKTTGLYEYIGFVDAGELSFKVTNGSGSWWPNDNQGDTSKGAVRVLITYNASNNAVSWKLLDEKVNTGSHDVDTDLFDYLNDNIVNDSNSTDYQAGAVTSEGPSVYAYINEVISTQEYSIPLYFGNLYHSGNRNGYNGSNDTVLKNWYYAPNIAPKDANGNDNFNAAIQGLVGSTLSANGNLTDPYDSTKELLYFSTTSPKTANNKTIIRHYGDLDFPFQKYTDDNGISTYTYDTVTSGYSVYYNGTNLYADYNNSSKNAKYTGTATIDGDAGFYPLSPVGCSWGSNNYAFGSKFTIDFTVSDEGKFTFFKDGETYNQDVIFSFTGDDDVWVFIDDQLVLDMGGCHTKATGIINFADLTATVVNAYDINEAGFDSFVNDSNNLNYGRSQLDTGVITKYFPEALANDFDEEYLNNKAEVHTLTMFYMERGLFDSNMSISFSITPLPSGLTVSKDIEGVDANDNVIAINPGLNADIQVKDTFNFTVVANNGTVKFSSYALTGIDSVAKQQTDITNNVISGVTGEIYASNFLNSDDGSAFGEGTSFVITEQDPTNTVFDYVSTRWKVYDADDGYSIVTSGNDKSAEFKFKSDEPSNYALNFINAINVGTLTVSKEDPLNEYTGRNFTFYIELDLDGSESDTTFAATKYEGLVYKVGDVEYKTKAGGKFTLKPGETATFTGIPVGASYVVTEDVSDNASWEATYTTNNFGTISNTTSVVTVSNSKKTEKGENHTIYVESNEVIKNWKEVPYVITLDGTALELTYVQSNDNLTIELGSDDGEITVTSATKSGIYNLTYKGKRDVTIDEQTDTHVYTGTLTVVVVKATDENYVFDFGLSSNLADTAGTGLFEGGAWGTDDTTATLETLTKDDATSNSQTEITATTGSTIDVSTGAYAGGPITFKPTKIMSQKETYTYTVWVGVNGKTAPAYGNLSPEDGAWVTGYITVMPANTVYYEDSFALNNSFVLPDLKQSNNMDENYGKDDAYKSGLTYSNGDKTELANNDTATFTFTGTGFDIISMTTGTSGGMKVVVTGGNGYNETFYVDCVYKNGTLYQVPVMSVMGLSYGTYEVTITSLDSQKVDMDDEGNTIITPTGDVYIDGIRIYNPLGIDAVEEYRDAEKQVYFTELRDMYFSASTLDGTLTEANFDAGKLSLVRLDGSDSVYVNPAAIVENYDGDAVKPAYTWADVYQSGPNNEMYLPKGHGIQFAFNAITGNSTLQIGAKATGSVGKISVYVDGEWKCDIELSSATDMYYDLSKYLGNAGTVTIINTSTNDDFVSLTTVKCSYALS